jgi:hypothetical protein
MTNTTARYDHSLGSWVRVERLSSGARLCTSGYDSEGSAIAFIAPLFSFGICRSWIEK